ncbi:RHS repeat-associated core domain-containing protein [Marinihelvus fidelis]|uniref:RHS repeat-associated core domain-containing protein n=1 Tax=Marinihelvus fidelis TaxID=2613842 RepID=A0A5N0TBM7_9GAMM|nr:RHS repeat-associated core domain-containing protein [Marinihelvus fidelis]KAA9132078.1 RHS repeat-associated core domain-containing protein [Marinihelvus fidelis]
MRVFSRFVFSLCVLAVSFSLFAQEPPDEGPVDGGESDQGGVYAASASEDGAIQPYVEYRKRVEAAQNVSSLDTGLFGEQVSLYNGSTAFAVTDIDIPGNSTLPVRLTRRFAVEMQPQNHLKPYDSLLRGAGNWDVDVPYMAATYHTGAGDALRCNGGYTPALVISAFRRGEVWQGISINVPGRGAQTAMGVQTQAPQPSGGATYKLTTTDRDVFDCIAMKTGFTGQGFRMTTTSGDRYYFDVATTRTAARLLKYVNQGGGQFPLPVVIDRNRLYLLASKIEDRFGNTVEFQYNTDGLPTRIWASDGREIILTYSGKRLSTATSHGRTWSYAYTNTTSGYFARLSSVTLPDNSQWAYGYTSNLMPSPDSAGLPPLPWCAGFPPVQEDAFTFTATHPSSAVGVFTFNNRRHYRSGVHASECLKTGDPANPDFELLVPHYFDVMSIDSKVITGPGLTSMTWGYAYSLNTQGLWGVPTEPAVYPCTTCTSEKSVTLSQPDGSKKRHTFGMRYYDNDGRQLRVETLRVDNTVIRTENSTYMTETQAATQSFYGHYGSNLGGIADPASTRVRPVTNRTISQDGTAFVWNVENSCSGALCFDGYARPTRVTRSSTVIGSPTRTETTTYHDNLTKWILGQVRRITCVAPTTALPAGCGSAGVEMFDRTYDATWAVPLVTERFGRVEQTLGWDTTSTIASGQRGTIRTVADGGGNTTTLTSWKRGTPQSIKHPGTPEIPAGATQTAQVHDSGWLNWVRDEYGYQTTYAHDAMGRLASIAWPTGDTTTWANTTLVFEKIDDVEYTIPAGHWRQTVSTGNGRRITYLDALWRPLLVREYDTASQSTTQRFQKFEYDHEGRATFTSYQSTSSNPVTGTWTEYDALGRTLSVAQDTELTPALQVTEYEYLSGFQTRVTNPRGHATTSRYRAWDEPGYDLPVYIAHPQSAWTHITRDVFGKPTKLRRSNSSSATGGTVALDRTYTYNASQQLCRSVEPETGATLMGYDNAGNLKWSAAGLPSGQGCEVNGTTTAVANRRVDRTYDGRNWLRSLVFKGGIGNQDWTYTRDGLPATIETNNSNGGTKVTNAYAYNKRRMPISESVQRDYDAAWTIGYAYNANGHLATLTYPSTLAVSYAPDALGQPTQAGSYATSVTHHPNGAVKQFTYGNSMVHTLAQNARGLPSRITDCAISGTCAAANRRLDLQYVYDGSGNVTAINDGVAGSKQDRDMTYDGLDRLTQTISPTTVFGTASFGYDVLDNLTSVNVTGGSHVRNHAYTYDTTKRLTQIRQGTTVVANLTYDVQGNLASKGPSGAVQNYSFDLGNRLRSVPNKETGYEYDGHGRRVYANTVGSAHILSQYAIDGKLLYQENHKLGERIDYIYLGTRLVAQRERPLATSTATLKYQHTDALGSPLVVTNPSKATIETSEYEPYGQLVNKPLFDGPGYTGHAQDAATGLTYMQQRYYDPQIGRFLSVDPVTAYAKPGQNFNRYWYGSDNPYRYIDPDGQVAVPWEGIGDTVKKRGLQAAIASQLDSPAPGPGDVAGAIILLGGVIEIGKLVWQANSTDSISSATDKIGDGTVPAEGVSGEKGEREGSGGREGANKKFDSVSGTNERSPRDGVRVKDLSGGGYIETHDSTKNPDYPPGTPTVKIRDGNGEVVITVRYPEPKK